MLTIEWYLLYYILQERLQRNILLKFLIKWGYVTYNVQPHYNIYTCMIKFVQRPNDSPISHTLFPAVHVSVYMIANLVACVCL